MISKPVTPRHDTLALAQKLEQGPLPGILERVQQQQWLSALEHLMPALYFQEGQTEGGNLEAQTLRDLIFQEMRDAMHHSVAPPRTRMKFGTSGWRGLLVEDFTLHTVACVTQGLVDTLLRPELHSALGVRDNLELRSRGCILAHDTRMMGPEFSEMAARVLLAHDFKVMYLGTATTPEVSAAIHETHAAFSINFTPSHNPFTYHGYKFNPADGGPAPSTLTVPVAQRANEIFDTQRSDADGQDQPLPYHALSIEVFDVLRQEGIRYLTLDPVELYKASLHKRLPWLNLQAIVAGINEKKLDLFIDNGFGACRGKYERLLEGIDPERLHVINGGEDPLFGGKNREPSVASFRTLQDQMRESMAPLVVGIMNDGDGDRFVGGGREGVLLMNKFGPLVVRYLTRSLGLQGDVTRSVMTSHMADAARRIYLPQGRLHETAVGFQYMRNAIPLSVNSWEESDGMSPMGWSLDKDGLVAALLLIDMVLDANEPAEALLARCEEELGTFYFERRKVAGRLGGAALTQALKQRFGTLSAGDWIRIQGRQFNVEKLITLDGFKVVFDNGWWFGVRPSGTEPVVRPYVETFTGPGATLAEQEEAYRWQQHILGWLEETVAETIQ